MAAERITTALSALIFVIDFSVCCRGETASREGRSGLQTNVTFTVARLRGFFESSGAFPTKETAASIDIERSRFVKHEGLVAKHSLTKSKKPLRYQ
jgi:hypothetical protein